MRTLYLVSKRLPRVCMGGSNRPRPHMRRAWSAPRVHGWFPVSSLNDGASGVCPACAWVVLIAVCVCGRRERLPRVCMGGSVNRADQNPSTPSAPRVHGWFPLSWVNPHPLLVCPACAWVVPSISVIGKGNIGLPRVCMGGSP